MSRAFGWWVVSYLMGRGGVDFLRGFGGGVLRSEWSEWKEKVLRRRFRLLGLRVGGCSRFVGGRGFGGRVVGVAGWMWTFLGGSFGLRSSGGDESWRVSRLFGIWCL